MTWARNGLWAVLLLVLLEQSLRMEGRRGEGVEVARRGVYTEYALRTTPPATSTTPST